MSKQRTTPTRRTARTYTRSRTEIRRMIDTVESVRNLDLDLVMKQYKRLMKKAGYEECLNEEEVYQNGGETAMDDVQTSVQRLGIGIDNDDQLKQITARVESLERDLQDKEKKMREKDEYIEKLKKINMRIEGTMDKKNMEYENKRMKEDMEQLRVELENANRAKSEALTRLSKMMVTKLTDNNPAISDLSDENRAMKLSEKYSELYDNQWTEAIEKLENGGNDEENSIKILLIVMKKCFKYCRQMAEGQMQELERILYFPADPQVKQLTKENKKLLKDCRKASAVDATDSIYKGVLNELNNSSRLWFYAQHLEAFIQRCSELFWMMCVQDPPLAFGPEHGIGDTFDSTYYREYTRRGTSVQFIVWLPLLLYEGGPILCKGVAQPFKVKSKEYSKRSTETVSTTPDEDRAAARYGVFGDFNSGHTAHSRDASALSQSHTAYSRESAALSQPRRTFSTTITQRQQNEYSDQQSAKSSGFVEVNLAQYSGLDPYQTYVTRPRNYLQSNYGEQNTRSTPRKAWESSHDPNTQHEYPIGGITSTYSYS